MSKTNQETAASAYYSVPEFAELAGVSKQAVYERIRRDLSGYTKKEGGRTLISGEALAYVGVKDIGKVDQGESKVLDQVSKESDRASEEGGQVSKGKLDNLIDSMEDMRGKTAEKQRNCDGNQSESGGNPVENKAESRESSAFLDYLIKENTRLLAELAQKDRIIAEKDALISGYADKFSEFAEREQEISAKALTATGQAQTLHAMSAAGTAADVIEAPEPEEVPVERPVKRKWPWSKK
jgi:hypothetical protein